MVTRLRFLGSGNAFTVGDGNWQSNMLIESDAGRRLLVDCGSDARLSLAEQGLGRPTSTRSMSAICTATISAAWNGWASRPSSTRQQAGRACSSSRTGCPAFGPAA